MALSELMWVEKYRPKTLDEVIDQEDVVTRLKRMLERPEEMPHLLFAGPPGTGKTTVALCIARQILGERWMDYTLELNASDERGIGMVRERVKTFASYTDRAAGIPFRIIILDEADEMTSDAQTALRRIMEESSRACRFILIANYSSSIIEPIQSRCAIFRFSKIGEEEVVDCLKGICESEGVKCSEKGLKLIYEVSGGDLRMAINLLQASSTFGRVDERSVMKATGLSSKARVAEAVRLALDGRFLDARNLMIELTRIYGLSEQDFLRYAAEELFSMDLDNAEEVTRLLAEYDYRLVAGAHPDIQLTAFLAELSAMAKKRPDR